MGDLVAATGCTAEVVRGWHRLGLLQGDGERFPVGDLERARLICFAECRGVGAEDIAEACRAQGDLLEQFAELLGVADRPRRGLGFEEVARATGLDEGTLRRIWVASGLGDQDEAFDDDLEALRMLAAVLGAGMPEEAVVQLVRVYADALGRVGEAENRLFHYYVHERFRADGLEGQELMAATSAVGDQVGGMVEPTVAYFHRKAFQRALREDFLLHVAEATTPVGETAGELVATILFVDLAGFTPLTDSMGDAAAAQVVERFSDLVRAATPRHDGRIVKQIGDEFMIAFTEPAKALGFALDLCDSVGREPQFPGLRIGAHHGTVLYREGDYIGGTVNVAARVTAAAGRDEFLVTQAFVDETPLPRDVEVSSRGPRALKGISGMVELYSVQRGGGRSDPLVDPVCQMVLEPGSTVTVWWEGRQVSFCSPACAERFSADPERYAAVLGGTEQPSQTTSTVRRMPSS
jgi:class 3 adenylate cyclase